MFGQSYQGGQSVKVFSPVGKDPVANWKLSNKKHVRKVYEKEVKGFVYECVGSTQGKMALPSNARDSCTCFKLIRELTNPIHYFSGPCAAVSSSPTKTIASPAILFGNMHKWGEEIEKVTSRWIFCFLSLRSFAP